MNAKRSRVEDESMEQKVHEWERSWREHKCMATQTYSSAGGSGSSMPNGHAITAKDAREMVTSWLELHVSDQPHNTLPIKVFKFWYEALIADDVAFVNELLSICSEEETNLLLNGRFMFEMSNCSSWVDNDRFKIPPCNFHLPVCLAMSFHCTQTLMTLIKMGADMFQQDIHGHNLVHALLLVSATHAGGDYSSLYKNIMATMTTEQKQQLLFMENDDGYRPLEFAGLLEEFHLQLVIFRTRGVYLFSRGNQGMYERLVYDVTDYETIGRRGRRNKSPLEMMVLVTKAGVSSELDRKALMSIPIQKWCQFKKSCNQVCFRVWFLLRFLFFIYVVTMLSTSVNYLASRKHTTSKMNNTNISKRLLNCSEAQKLSETMETCEASYSIAYACSGSLTILAVLLICIFAVIFFVINTYTTMKRICKRSLPNSVKYVRTDRLVSTLFYDGIQILISISFFVVSVSVVSYVNSNNELFYVTFMFTFIAGSILEIWSLLFFLQFGPGIGYFVIAIQRMLGDMLRFMVIYAIFLTIFNALFESLLSLNGYCNESHFQQGGSIYSTFIVMLNMIDISAYRQISYSLNIVHMSYVVLVSILLQNFLIAIMSNTAQEIEKYKRIIVSLQRLHTDLSVEDHFRWILYCLYKWYQRKYLIVEGDRILLPTLEEAQPYFIKSLVNNKKQM